MVLMRPELVGNQEKGNAQPITGKNFRLIFHPLSFGAGANGIREDFRRRIAGQIWRCHLPPTFELTITARASPSIPAKCLSRAWQLSGVKSSGKYLCWKSYDVSDPRARKFHSERNKCRQHNIQVQFPGGLPGGAAAVWRMMNGEPPAKIGKRLFIQLCRIGQRRVSGASGHQFLQFVFRLMKHTLLARFQIRNQEMKRRARGARR